MGRTTDGRRTDVGTVDFGTAGPQRRGNNKRSAATKRLSHLYSNPRHRLWDDGLGESGGKYTMKTFSWRSRRSSCSSCSARNWLSSDDTSSSDVNAPSNATMKTQFLVLDAWRIAVVVSALSVKYDCVQRILFFCFFYKSWKYHSIWIKK